MNFLSWIIIGAVAMWLAFALVYTLRRKGCGCGGGCGHDCSACSEKSCSGKCRKE